MSDDNEKLKVHIHYGGLMSKEGNKLCYRGGSIAPDMLVDPDFLTFSIFEDFKKKGEELTDVEKLWYRLPNEELSEARSIWHEKDKEIIKMASEAKECREVYVYVEYSVSTHAIVADGANLANLVRENEGIDECLDDGDKADDEYGSDDENIDEEEESEQSDGEERDEDSEEEDRDEERLEETRQEEIRREEGGVQSEDENQILGEGGGDDPRFESLFALAEETPIVRGETTQPNVNDEDSDVEDSKNCVVLTSSDNLFEVMLGDDSFEVSLRLRHCACRAWDLTGIPCSHAIRVINENHKQPENHMDYYYKTGVWIETYRDNIKPVNGELFWEKTGKEPIAVPGFRKMPGRPKKKRMKPAHESPSKPNRVTRGGRTITCGNCKQVGHNRGTCKNEAFMLQGPSRKRGRPRKIFEDEGSNSYPPKKRKVNQPHPSIPPSTPNQSQTSLPPPSSTASQPSTRPQVASFIASTSSNAPSERGRGRGRRGRPPGRGQARKKVTVPRGVGIYMCPFSNRVFECFGSHARDIGGGSSQDPN